MTLAEPAPSGVESGVVFTRRWVVDLILDLVGYTPDRDLGALALVEPSCGAGAFLGPVVERLTESCARHGRDLRSLVGAIQAFDLVEENAQLTRKVVAGLLEEGGLVSKEAAALAVGWVRSGDFLLEHHEPASADIVVGNPPYVRLESIPRQVVEAYRRACPTMRGRSDLYVGFIERGLDLLRPGGVLGFICADRWMRNQYGANLRALISGSYAVDTVVAMHDVDAFEDLVSAYPAVVVLRNEAQGPANVVETRQGFGADEAPEVAAWARTRSGSVLERPTFTGARVGRWFDGRGFWPTGSPAQVALIADLEDRFPPLEDPATGTRVGIGVATGCDEVYITTDDSVVEQERLLPLVMSSDITTGVPEWSGSYLVNPWNSTGLVDLDHYPQLQSYLLGHGRRLGARHVARQRPDRWYRTIDRVDTSLQGRPKLLLPDLKAHSHPVLDDGRFYPHHNLYYVVSDTWDLEVLGGLLLSDVANLFVGAYCVRMRGGCYRFQAQYVRRIRVPEVTSVSAESAHRLAQAFRNRDRAAATTTAARLYGLDANALQMGTLNPATPDPG